MLLGIDKSQALRLVVAHPAIAQIFYHPRLRKILRTRGFFEQLTWLGMFGGKTWKPVRLVSDDPCVAGFYRRG